MLKRLFTSLGLTAAIASVISWPLTYIGIDFISSLIALTTLQFVGFFFYNEYVSRKMILAEQKMLIDAEKELLKQSAEVSCPCDRGIKTVVPINIAERNEYICPGCNKNIHVIIETKTALVTTPVDAPVIPNGN